MILLILCCILAFGVSNTNMSWITFMILFSGKGKNGIKEKKKRSKGGNAIKNEKETAFARLLKRFEKICFRKKFMESNKETPSKPGK